MKLILMLLIVFISIQSLAQEDSLSLPDDGSQSIVAPAPVPAPAPNTPSKEVSKKSSGPSNILDFEGEVIEGERRRPDLFLQMSIDNVKFNSLIYNREDFNDYLEVDRRGRTRYIKVK